MQLNVSDGFRLGCGMILAGLAFIFSLVIIGTLALLVATLLNINIPFLPPRT